MQKRGLSDVVTTVLVILLVVIAVGVIWAFVQRMIQQTEQQVVTDKFTSGFSIPPASVNIAKISSDLFSVNFFLKRNEGESDVVAANVIVQDNSGKSVSQRVNIPNSIKQFETQKISLAVNGISNVKTISVVPIIKDSNNREVNALAGAVFDSASQSVSGAVVDFTRFGLKGYWKFDEDAGAISFADLVGSNPGTSQILNTGGAVTSGQSDSVSGKSVLLTKGTDGGGGFVNFGTGGGDLIKNTPYTIALWFKPTAVMAKGTTTGLLSRAGGIPSRNTPYNIGIRMNPDTPQFYAPSSISSHSTATSSSPVINADNINRWYFVSVVFDPDDPGGSNIKMYIDGMQNPASSYAAIPLTTENYLLYVGSDHKYTSTDNRFFTGNIDEVMIFNKALISNEIKQIYNFFKPEA